MPWWDIFFEALWQISFLPLGHQNSFFAVVQFHPEQRYAAIGFAMAGAMLACVLTWWVGSLIAKTMPPHSQQQLAPLRHAFAEYGWPALLLSWAPLAHFLPLFAGVLGYSARKTLALCAVAFAGYYTYQAGLFF